MNTAGAIAKALAGGRHQENIRAARRRSARPDRRAAEGGRRLRADAARGQRGHRRRGLRKAQAAARRRDRDAGAGRRKPAAAGRERLPRSGAAAGDHRADCRTISRRRIRINCCRCTTPTGRCAAWSRRSRTQNADEVDRSGADGVHGSPVRRVVRDAVGAGSDQGRAAERRELTRGRRRGRWRIPRRGRPICARAARWPSARWCWSAWASSRSNAERLRRWLNDWQLPFAVTPKVKGIVDETQPELRRRDQRHGRRRRHGRCAQGRRSA